MVSHGHAACKSEGQFGLTWLLLPWMTPANGPRAHEETGGKAIEAGMPTSKRKQDGRVRGREGARGWAGGRFC